MTKRRRRKCRNCGELFRPDVRNLRHQRYCAKPACRRASKTANQQRWLAKAANHDYFRGPENVERVRAWRAAHPGYWRQSGRALQEHSPAQATEVEGKIVPLVSSALQEHSPAQATEIEGKTAPLVSSALQELSRAQPYVLMGLIAQLTGAVQQEDIVHTARRLQDLAQDILNASPERVHRGDHGP